MYRKFFIIPVRDLANAEDAYNSFVSSVSVLKVREQFIEEGFDSFWAIVVEYMKQQSVSGSTTSSRKDKIDYKEQLSPKVFDLYAKLREWRKEESLRSGMLLFSIFTNAELAAIARDRPKNKTEFMKIEGIRKGKADSYGEDVLRIVKEHEFVVNPKMADTDQEMSDPENQNSRQMQTEAMEKETTQARDKKKEQKKNERRKDDEKGQQLILPNT